MVNEMDFEKAIQIVLKNEGGYSNNPSDPGKETNFGISRKQYPRLDIRGLTINKAREIYFYDYWIPSKAGYLPDKLRLIYFDMAVLHGIRAAVVILQRAIRSKGCNIRIDGVIGDQTLALATRLEPERLRAYRVKRLADIARRPSLEKFWYGWFRRAIKV